MRSLKLSLLAAFAIQFAISGCAPAGTSGATPAVSPTPAASPSTAPVTMKESGKCAVAQTKADVLFAAYDDWLEHIKFTASFDGFGDDLRTYLLQRSNRDIPKELWTVQEDLIEIKNGEFRAAIGVTLAEDWGQLVPEQEAALQLVFKKRAAAIVAASPGSSSDNTFLLSVRMLDAFPDYGNELKMFLKKYCD